MPTTINKSVKTTFPTVKEKTTRDLRQLMPSIQDNVIAALAECQRRGIRIFITRTWGSPEYQHELFLQGKSKLDSGLSMHEHRLAVDIACKGPKLYDPATLRAAAIVFKAHGALWGGDWDNDGDTEDEKFRDWPHFQFVTLVEQEKVRAFKMNWDKLELYLKARKK